MSKDKDRSYWIGLLANLRDVCEDAEDAEDAEDVELDYVHLAARLRAAARKAEQYAIEEETI